METFKKIEFLILDEKNIFVWLAIILEFWAVVKTHNNFSCLQKVMLVSTRNWTVSLLGISSPSSEYFSLERFKRFFFINQLFWPMIMMYNVWAGSTGNW